MKTLIIIPVLNEFHNLNELLRRIKKSLKETEFSILFIDDGSKDGTVEIIKTNQKKNKNIYLIQRKKRHWGCQRGSALQTGWRWGLRNKKFKYFVELDGDLSHRPEELKGLIKTVKTGCYDVVIASKYLVGSAILKRSRARNCLSLASTIISRMLINCRIKDYSNGYRAYNRKAALFCNKLEFRYGSPIYLSEVLAYWIKANFRIIEIPSIYVGRNDGLSKLRWVDAVKALIALIEISFKYHYQSQIKETCIR